MHVLCNAGVLGVQTVKKAQIQMKRKTREIHLKRPTRTMRTEWRLTQVW